jgi:alcohol dehydrogenase class IV
MNQLDNFCFELTLPPKILFGPQRLKEIGQEASKLGTRVFLCTGKNSQKNSGNLNSLCSFLQKENLEIVTIETITQEPDIHLIDKMVYKARQKRCDLIIALGGGSVIDAGKALAGMATNQGKIEEYLEVGNTIKRLKNSPLPFIAIPTTAGSGAEATKNAVILWPEKKLKKSFRDPKLLPQLALIDPCLTLSLPPFITATTGMDTLCQLIEAYLSKRAQPFSDALALYGTKLVGESLVFAFKNGKDLLARKKMALASLISGIVLNNSGLGAAHGIATGLGAVLNIPHGLACAISLPPVLEINLKIATLKMADLAEALTNQKFTSPKVGAQTLINQIHSLLKTLKLPSKITRAKINKITLEQIIKASQGGSMSGNPIPLSKNTIKKLLETILT